MINDTPRGSGYTQQVEGSWTSAGRTLFGRVHCPRFSSAWRHSLSTSPISEK